MSVLGGVAGTALALVAEEVLVTSRGGPSAITGIFGSAVSILDHVADPTRPGIPDLTKPTTAAPKPTTPALPGQTPTTNPLEAPPISTTNPYGLPSPGPVRDYNPTSLVPKGSSGLL